jgi:pimeloyl-ACP methyl ester carboxylesterase
MKLTETREKVAKGESQPFAIHIDHSVLADLKQRIAATRWVEEVENADWKYGSNRAYLQELLAYWQNDFDWPVQEQYLNSFSHFKASVDGHGIHYIHEKGKTANAIPLLLIHGFPDSFVRFLKIIPLLTEGDENGVSFDVIVPSIPGYGFSDKPSKTGMDPKKIGGLFSNLMTDVLGYEKFIVHGGDFGTSISECMALYHEESLIGIHLTDVPFGHGMKPLDNPSSEEKKFSERTQRWTQTEGAYAMIQSTKPQSLAYGLNDSPVGLAGWIIEKFEAWSDNHGDIENAFSKDELLTNLTIYWSTQTINSAIHLYSETLKTLMNAMYNPLSKLNPFDKTGQKSTVPAGFVTFPKDISKPPREYAERFFNVKQWSVMDVGGHFAAMEKPDLLAADIRRFTGKLKEVD